MNANTTSKEKDYDLIERFLNFELNQSELHQVEQRMENDAVFKDRLYAYQQMDTFIDQPIQTNLAPKEAKIVKLDLKKTERRKWTGLQAAAAMLILALGFLFVFKMLSNQTTHTATLAEQYWERSSDLGISNVRGTNKGDGELPQLMEAAKALEAGKTAETLSLLEEISPSDAAFPQASLLKGQAYFEQENYDRAIEQFQLVIEDRNKNYNDLAYWYQALSYLQIDQKEAAQQNLNFIIEQRYPLAKQAEKLLEEL